MKIRPEKKRELQWWAYCLTMVVLLFLVPFLVSARDDASVIAGFACIVAYCVITWKFWLRDLIKRIVK